MSSAVTATRFPRSKLAGMWAIVLLIPVLALIVLVLGYYTFAKLTYTCGSFAQLDDELGWVLKPAAASCLGHRRAFSGQPPWFEAPVYTDANGFRAARSGGETPAGAIMTVGDSHTFGYGVTYEQSYPGALQALSKIPVVNVASPAYSSIQALLLAERWVAKLRPRMIIFLELGQWGRGACRGSGRPAAIAKPCYWRPPGRDDAEIVLPPAGRVRSWARWGLLPGGMLGAGEITWTYFLASRPAMQTMQLLTRMGLLAGFAHDFVFPAGDHEGPVVRRAVVDHFFRLSRSAAVPLIVLDPQEQLPAAFFENRTEPAPIYRLGKKEWDLGVAPRMALLPPNQQLLPHDGHFGPGANRLIAEWLHSELRTFHLID
jgi:hypothetical protein